jgi:hypothetical protein
VNVDDLSVEMVGEREEKREGEKEMEDQKVRDGLKER